MSQRVPASLAGPPRRLALLIAVRIGLLNFAEGLAIGQSAASGEIAPTTPIVVGFGLPTTTDVFRIVPPRRRHRRRRPDPHQLPTGDQPHIVAMTDAG